MKRKSKKTEKLEIKEKAPWEVSKGHPTHRGGGGKHDTRPNRERTRQNQNRRAIDGD